MTSSRIDIPDVQLHGWDASAGFWHGPHPVTRLAGRAWERIKNSRAGFHGKLLCRVPGLPCLEFHTAIHDLGDIGVATVQLDGARGGPAGVLAVLPAARRGILRPEFAFSFMTLLSFFAGPDKAGSELAIHDYIDEIVRAGAPGTQVFAVETAELEPDAGIVLSAHFERLAVAMVDWLSGQDPDSESAGDGASECFAAPHFGALFAGYAAGA